VIPFHLGRGSTHDAVPTKVWFHQPETKSSKAPNTKAPNNNTPNNKAQDYVDFTDCQAAGYAAV